MYFTGGLPSLKVELDRRCREAQPARDVQRLPRDAEPDVRPPRVDGRDRQSTSLHREQCVVPHPGDPAQAGGLLRERFGRVPARLVPS